MQCYDWEILSRYQDGSLGDAENQCIAEHLMGCPSCQEKMRFLGQVGLFLRIALGSRRHAECLADEELGAYLSGRMSVEDRTRVEAHLLICPTCLHDLAALSDPETLTTSSESPVPDVRAHERFKHLAARPRVREPMLRMVTGWGLRAVAAGLLAALALGSWWTPEVPEVPTGPGGTALSEMRPVGAVSGGGFLSEISLGPERTMLPPDSTDLARFAHDVELIFREIERVGDKPRFNTFEMVQEDILNSGVVESIARLKELTRDVRELQFLGDCEYLLMRVVKVEHTSVGQELPYLITEIRRLNLIETARLLEMEGGRSLWLASL